MKGFGGAVNTRIEAKSKYASLKDAGFSLTKSILFRTSVMAGCFKR